MRVSAIGLIVILIAGTFLIAPVSAADNFPAKPQIVVKHYKSPTARPPHPKPFYGYIPPAPIRHTWPGGYRAIFHEMTNTLIEHILGWY